MNSSKNSLTKQNVARKLDFSSTSAVSECGETPTSVERTAKPWIITKRGRRSEGLLVFDSKKKKSEEPTSDELLCAKCKCSPVKRRHKKFRDIFDALSPFSKSGSKQWKKSKDCGIRSNSKNSSCNSPKCVRPCGISENRLNSPAGNKEIVPSNTSQNADESRRNETYDGRKTPVKNGEMQSFLPGSPVFDVFVHRSAQKKPQQLHKYGSVKAKNKRLTTASVWKVDDRGMIEEEKFSAPVEPTVMMNRFTVTDCDSNTPRNEQMKSEQNTEVPKATDVANAKKCSLGTRRLSSLINVHKLSDFQACTPIKNYSVILEKTQSSPIFDDFIGETPQLKKSLKKARSKRLKSNFKASIAVSSSKRTIEKVTDTADVTMTPKRTLRSEDFDPSSSLLLNEVSGLSSIRSKLLETSLPVTHSVINETKITCDYISCTPKKSIATDLKNSHGSPIFEFSVGTTGPNLGNQKGTKKACMPSKTGKEDHPPTVQLKTQANEVETKNMEKNIDALSLKSNLFLDERTDSLGSPALDKYLRSPNGRKNTPEMDRCASLLHTTCDFIGCTPEVTAANLKRPHSSGRRKLKHLHSRKNSGVNRINDERLSKIKVTQNMKINSGQLHDKTDLVPVLQTICTGNGICTEISDRISYKTQVGLNEQSSSGKSPVENKIRQLTNTCEKAPGRLDASFIDATCNFIGCTPGRSLVNFRRPLSSLLANPTAKRKDHRNIKFRNKCYNRSRHHKRDTDIAFSSSPTQSSSGETYSKLKRTKVDISKTSAGLDNPAHGIGASSTSITKSSRDQLNCTPTKRRTDTNTQCVSPVFEISVEAKRKFQSVRKVRGDVSADASRTPKKSKSNFKARCGSPVFETTPSIGRFQSPDGVRDFCNNKISIRNKSSALEVQRIGEASIEIEEFARRDLLDQTSKCSNLLYFGSNCPETNSDLVTRKSSVILEKTEAICSNYELKEYTEELPADLQTNMPWVASPDVKTCESVVTVAMANPKKSNFEPVGSPVFSPKREDVNFGLKTLSNVEPRGITTSPEFITSSYCKPPKKKASFIIRKRKRHKQDSSHSMSSVQDAELLRSVQQSSSLQGLAASNSTIQDNGCNEQTQKLMNVFTVPSVPDLGLPPKNFDTEIIEEFNTEKLHLEPETTKGVKIEQSEKHSKSSEGDVAVRISQVNSNEEVQRTTADDKKRGMGPLQTRMEAVLRKTSSERRVRIYEKEKGVAPVSGLAKDFRVLDVRNACFPLRVYALEDEGFAVVLISRGVVKNKYCIYPGCWLKIYPPWDVVQSSRGGMKTYFSISTCDVTHDRIPDLTKVTKQPWKPADPYVANPELFIEALLGNCSQMQQLN